MTLFNAHTLATQGTLTTILEHVAQQIRSRLSKHTRPTPESLLELQIGLCSEQLDRLRDVRDDQLRRILRAECYVGTDLLKLDSYAPATIFHFRFEARDNLKNKLLQLDMERRRLLLAHERDRQGLHTTLLQLLSEHAALEF